MTQIVLNQMAQLKFLGMHHAYQTMLETGKSQELTNDEFINYLIQSEWDERKNRKMQRLIRSARFRYQTGVEEVDFEAHRNLDKTHFIRLSDCTFIQKGENLLITGPTGTGKSFLVSALGRQACINGYSILYFNSQKLFPHLRMSKADGSYLRTISKFEKQDLIILDDFGMNQLDKESRLMLMEIIEDRHGKKSTVISSQLPVSKWYDVIGDATIADAILDRLVHHAHRIELKGQSMRKLKNK